MNKFEKFILKTGRNELTRFCQRSAHVRFCLTNGVPRRFSEKYIELVNLGDSIRNEISKLNKKEEEESSYPGEYSSLKSKYYSPYNIAI